MKSKCGKVAIDACGGTVQSYLPLESDRRHLRVGQNYLPYAQRENPNSVINVCAPTTLSTQKVKGALGTCTVLSKGTFFSLILQS